MNFVTGIVLPQISNKDAQPLDIVEEHLKYIISQASSGSLHEVIEDYFLMQSKRMRARICLDAAKTLNLRAKDIAPWAVVVELISNTVRVKEALAFSALTGKNFSSEDIRGRFEGESAANAFMSLLPTIVSQLPVNDGIRTRLMCTISDFYLNFCKELLDLTQLDLNSPVESLRAKIKEYIQARSAFLYELPVQGTAIIAGLSVKESVRMGEPFKFLGELQFLIDDALVLIDGENKLISEHNLNPINLLLLGQKPTNVNEDYIKSMISSEIFKTYIDQIKSHCLVLEKNDGLKPWPKMLDLYRGYISQFMRAIEPIIKVLS